MQFARGPIMNTAYLRCVTYLHTNRCDDAVMRMRMRPATGNAIYDLHDHDAVKGWIVRYRQTMSTL
eukprot:5260121-Pyramimonas_sp.AAC.1